MVDVVDDFIGKKFGKQNQLEVVSRTSNQKNKAMYIVHCSECAKDTDLFGDGNFKMSKANLNKGAVPCGCGMYRYNAQQSLLRVARKILDCGFNIELLGLAETWRGTDTKLQLKCRVHDTIWKSVSVHTFLGERYNGMCIDCEKEFISSTRTSDESEVIRNALETGKFPQGSLFWRTPEKRATSVEGHNSGNKWAMLCGVCSSDKYVEAGLCTGVFGTSLASLKKGFRPCRCGEHFDYTVEQRLFQIEEEITKSNGKYSFVGFKRNNNWQHTSKLDFDVYCKDHGTFKYNIGSMKRSGINCPQCSLGGGFKTHLDGYVYILKVEGLQGDFTGYGISNYVDERLRTHEVELAKHGCRIVNKRTFKFTGNTALSLENGISKSFILHRQEISGFKTEATFAHLYNDVVAFVASQAHNY